MCMYMYMCMFLFNLALAARANRGWRPQHSHTRFERVCLYYLLFTI